MLEDRSDESVLAMSLWSRLQVQPIGLGTHLICINITVPCTRKEAFSSPFSGQADFASQGAPWAPLHTLVCPSVDSFYSH